MNHNSSIPTFPMARAAATLAGQAVVVGAIAAGACVAAGRGDQAIIAAVTGAAALAGSIAGLVPVWMRSGGSLEGAALGFVVGMLPRMAVTGGALALLAVTTELPVLALGLWTAGWYLLLMAAEVAVVVAYLKRRDGTASGTPGTEAIA